MLNAPYAEAIPFGVVSIHASADSSVDLPNRIFTCSEETAQQVDCQADVQGRALELSLTNVNNDLSELTSCRASYGGSPVDCQQLMHLPVIGLTTYEVAGLDLSSQQFRAIQDQYRGFNTLMNVSERRLFQMANVLAVLAGISVACFCWFHAGWLCKGLASIVSGLGAYSITWSLLAPVQYSAVTPYGLTSSDWDQIVSGSSLTLGIISFIGMALLLRRQNNPSVLKGLSLYGGLGFVAIAFYLFAFALLGLGYAD
ncbi:hypothetical protein [Vacuolonema iberomarrocanum]|uniref:hypothetical protein n=1 Tax=Vacuolonema iberomarrocanum TaxID=3454632 RepID=UPI001A029C01|nr:hypothetical protein [filamentous cyanobacterium LEGE 07170]